MNCTIWKVDDKCGFRFRCIFVGWPAPTEEVSGGWSLLFCTVYHQCTHTF